MSEYNQNTDSSHQTDRSVQGSPPAREFRTINDVWPISEADKANSYDYKNSDWFKYVTRGDSLRLLGYPGVVLPTVVAIRGPNNVVYGRVLKQQDECDGCDHSFMWSPLLDVSINVKTGQWVHSSKQCRQSATFAHRNGRVYDASRGDQLPEDEGDFPDPERWKRISNSVLNKCQDPGCIDKDFITGEIFACIGKDLVHLAEANEELMSCGLLNAGGVGIFPSLKGHDEE